MCIFRYPIENKERDYTQTMFKTIWRERILAVCANDTPI